MRYLPFIKIQIKRYLTSFISRYLVAVTYGCGCHDVIKLYQRKVYKLVRNTCATLLPFMFRDIPEFVAHPEINRNVMNCPVCILCKRYFIQRNQMGDYSMTVHLQSSLTIK